MPPRKNQDDLAGPTGRPELQIGVKEKSGEVGPTPPTILPISGKRDPSPHRIFTNSENRTSPPPTKFSNSENRGSRNLIAAIPGVQPGEGVIAPQPGPQTAFLASDADIAIFGGSASGGKTYAAILSLAMGVKIPGYSAIVFRRTSPELTGGGSIWEESQQPYKSLGGIPRTAPQLDWRFPCTDPQTGLPAQDALIEFRHLQQESDVYHHHGKQYAQVVFDELTTFEESQFWYLLSRLRSTSGVKPFIRATCNPDPDSFVRQLIDWWIDPETGYAIPERSGVVRWFVRDTETDALIWSESREDLLSRYPEVDPTSLTFIPSKIDDNKILLAKDPLYKRKLQAMPLVQRQRLLDGNWNIRAGEGTLFREQWFKVIDALPSEHRILARIRAWDKAATPVSDKNRNPDWTRGALVCVTDTGEFIIEDFQSIRGTPKEVLNLMRRTAEMDPPNTTIAMWQDPAAAGIADVDNTRAYLAGFPFRVLRQGDNKQAYAEIWSAIAEQGKISLLRGRWHPEFIKEAHSFPNPKNKKSIHDDMIDAVSLAFQFLKAYAHNAAIGTPVQQPGYIQKSFEGKTPEVEIGRDPGTGYEKTSPRAPQHRWRPGSGPLPKRY